MNDIESVLPSGFKEFLKPGVQGENRCRAQDCVLFPTDTYPEDFIRGNKEVLEKITKIPCQHRLVNLRELLDIQQAGHDAYLARFGEYALVAWNSAAVHKDGDYFVPYLWPTHDGQVLLFWRWFCDGFGPRALWMNWRDTD